MLTEERELRKFIRKDDKIVSKAITALVRAVRADERKLMEKEGDAALKAAVMGKE